MIDTPHRRSALAALGTTAAIVILIVGLLVVGLRTFGTPAGGPVTPPERRILPPRPLTIDALRQLPGVAEVTVANPQQNPPHRIIHILNWHDLELEHFTADMLAAGDEPAGEWGLEQAYDQHLDEVEAPQDEQIEFLRALVDRHGVQAVYQEGLAPEDMERFQERIDVVWRAVERMPDTVENPIDELIRHELRTDLLLMGAAVRLWLEVEAPEILPVEDKALYEAANPVVDGQVQWDDEANEGREDAIVRKLLERPVSVVILGGGHDLSDNIERLAPACGYVRVETHQVRWAVFRLSGAVV